MEENNENNPRKRSRYFLYQDGVNFAIGIQNVRYEPNLEKDVYGTTEVTIEHPTRRSIKNRFPLSLYPTVQDEPGMDPSKNITENVEEGIRRMFVEANKSAGLLVKSTCHIPSEKFDYKNIRILSEDDLKIIIDGNGFPDTMTLRGKVVHSISCLRKGDVVRVGDIRREVDSGNRNKFVYYWRCRWVPKDNKFSLFERIIKRPFWKFFNKPLYECRYGCGDMMTLPMGSLVILSGKDVEPETLDSKE